MSTLIKTRDREAYFEKIENLSRSTKASTKAAINAFDRFCHAKYDGRLDEEIIKELGTLKAEQKEQVVFDLLQTFVNHLHTQGLNPVSIRSTFKRIKPYLAYRASVKIHSEDVKENIKFPKITKRKPHPLTGDEVKKILDYASPRRKALYLTLLSSGIRIQEACHLRKRDFDNKFARYKITLHPTYTKSKVERITFISKEAEGYVIPVLDKIKDEELVFAVNPDPWRSELTEEAYFSRIRKRAKMTDTYESGVNKITLHSFRSYFISKCDRIDMGLGHALAGHDHYMKQYERFVDQELLDFYLKAEPHLTIHGTPDCGMNEELRKQIQELEKKNQEIEILKQKQEEIIMDLEKVKKRQQISEKYERVGFET